MPKKRKKPPKFTMPGGPLRCKVGVPFHLECCDCGLDHIVIVNKVTSKGVATIGMFRDDHATEHDREGMTQEQWQALGGMALGQLAVKAPKPKRKGK